MGRRKKEKKSRAGRKQRVSRGVLAALVFFLPVALYVNTLGHGFVFDDDALILQNRQVTDFRIAEIFSGHGYRPVRTLTYAVNYALGGENPVGYHLFNVLLHALNALFLFRLLEEWNASSVAAAFGAVAFAVHPVQTAAVAYISGRKDLLATCFVLLGLRLYTRFRKAGGWKRMALSMTCFLLAVFSKEVAVVFPVLLLFAEALVLEGPAGASPLARVSTFLRGRWMAAVAALLVSGAGVWFVLFVGRATRMTGYWGGSPGSNWGTSLRLFAHYLKLVFWPHPLIADYKGEVFPLSTGFGDPWTLFSGLLLLGFLGSIFWIAPRFPWLAFGQLWFFVCLTPVLQIVPFHELAADHFLYLPLVGLSLGVVQTVMSLGEGVWRPRMAGAAAVLFLVWSGLAVARNGDWKDSLTLWEATYATAPGSYRANANLGKIYFGDPTRREKGLELTRRAVELDPDDPVASSNLGAMFYVLAQGAYTRGDLTRAEDLTNQAVERLERALAYNRRDGSILSNLGNCQRMLGALWERRGDPFRAQAARDKAIEFFKNALKRDRRDPVKSAWYNLALVYLDQNNCLKAVESLEEFLKIRPRHAAANLQIGWCRMRLDQPRAAIPYLETAISIEPTAEAFSLLIDAQQAAGQPELALEACQRALESFPDQASLHLRAGLLYRDAGNKEMAIEHLQKAAASSADPETAQKAKAWLRRER